MEHKCGRPTLPPSSDPKVQARREKAREYAQKKREGVKQVKAETKASATINMAIKGKIARKKMADAKEATKPPAPAAPAAKVVKPRAPRKPKAELREDTNRLHNLPEDLQKKIMGMARKWDDDGVSVSSYTMKAKDFLNLDFLTYMTKQEDPTGGGFEDLVYNIIEKSKEENKGDVRYKWTDDKNVKNKNYKRMMMGAKRKVSKYGDWDKNNGRIIMFILGDDNLISYVGDINKKDDDVYAATYGKL